MSPLRRTSAPRFLAGLLLAALLLSQGGCGRSGEEAAEDQAFSTHPRAEDYLAVAFGNRWGAAPEVLHKRTRPLTIRLAGEPRYEDRLQLRRLVEQLGSVPGMVPLELQEWEPAPEREQAPSGAAGRDLLEIVYLPPSRFTERAPGFDGSYPAVYSCPEGDGPVLGDGLVLLPAGEDYPQYLRDDYLLEGLVACLGLAGGLEEPHESAFQVEANGYEVGLLALDRELVELHYRPELPPGISRREAAWRLGMDVPPPRGASGAAP